MKKIVKIFHIGHKIYLLLPSFYIPNRTFHEDMKLRRTDLYIFVIFLFATNSLLGQCSVPGLTSSLFCHDAPVLCELDCLDGFRGRTPEALFEPQPAKGELCANGGNPDNMSWFAFVAGSTEVSITITPSNCIRVDNTTYGLQAGIYSSCDFKNRLILDCYNDFTITNPAPITLSSTDFVVGQIYYVWVDGAAGTICDYRITVNKGSQPFELPEIETVAVSDIENNIFSGDTIRVCRGIENAKFKVENYGLYLFYKWTIEPSTPDFPDGLHPSVIDSSFWNFNMLGNFDICVVADNRCDTTEAKCIHVIVEDIPNQDFGEVRVCSNSFPYAGPQNVDLFGDGNLYSWEGPNIMTPGVTSYNVSLPNGCRYNQTVDIVQIPLSARLPVVEVSCGPFEYHGIEISENISGMPVNIANAAQNGCDSLVSLDAYILNVSGSFITGNCNSATVPLAFSISNVSCPPGYTLEYIWKDPMGNQLFDNDGVDSVLQVSSTMMVTLEVKITYGNLSCDIFLGGRFVDTDAVLPQIPNTSAWPEKICSNTSEFELTIPDAANADSYQWTLASGLSFKGNNSGTTVTISVESGFAGGDICVRSVNSCGLSAVACSNIRLVVLPEAEITLVEGECINEPISLIATVSNVVSANMNFDWSINGASQIIPISASQRIVRYETPGMKSVSLIIDNESCISNPINFEFEVFQKIDAPIISCESTANSVSINWNSDDCVSSYDLEINGQLISQQQSTSYMVDGLVSGTMLNLRLMAKSDCPCGDAIATSTCYALDCGNAVVSLQNPNPVICEDAWNQPVQLNLTISNTYSNVIPVWSGAGISQNGLFTPASAGLGQHRIYVDIDDLGCKYRDSVVFQLFKNPDLSYRTLDPQCVEDLFGSILLSDIFANGNYIIELDGERVGEEIEGVGIGEHTLVLIDANQCRTVRRVSIRPPVVPDYELEGDTAGFDNGVLRFSVKPMGFEQRTIDSISWYINGELFCSGPQCFNILLSNFPAGDYIHQIFIYYDDCYIEESFGFVVKEIYRFYISNAIRPRAGNENSRWVVKTNDNDLKIKDVSIYNRWGNLIFRKSDFNPNDEQFVWDGNFNGRPVTQDVYVYAIRYIDELGQEQIITGDITVFD